MDAEFFWPSEIPNLKGKTILFAEDDMFSREMMTYLLKKTGAELLVAKDGPETVRLFYEGKPDILLLDISLPGKNGFEILRKISPQKKGVPVIAKSAYALLNDIKKYHEAGFDGYLTKPISQESLYEILYKHLIV
jgi:CheY-like chemotaxis protein